MTDILKQGAESMGLTLSERQLEQFVLYKELLLEWNERVNLTAITEETDIAVKHFMDSMVVYCKSKLPENSRLIDVGTGAGFPGVPIKIIRPDIKLTLLDSLSKRLNFLNEVTERLALDNVTLIHSRAEDGGQNPDLREGFDVAVSRAVANMSVLSEYCLPFVAVGGLFLAYKSKEIEQELNDAKNAIKLLGGEISEVMEVTLPQSDLKRCIVVIRKVRQTSPKYPRQAGKPSKNPLT